ncbi:hypothetical protein [Adhaeribacter rhizoryzae]|uniref:AbiTii domain-containing protein n=1 Tax=Adhaeribacter rhizoryzae TaxID=2607907 RepID=A0A5M6D027_9BACT|nr:hypothetical protein [Adhaeribacter rhizoryzae]KAA5540827.1 hypothetical protein F0145_22230 [Adhaeribacter rhizoryzae]
MIEKIRYIVKEICQVNKDFACVEVIQNSEMKTVARQARYRWEPEIYYLTFLVNPAIYIKYATDMSRITGNIKHYFDISADWNTLRVEEITIDYDKVNILNTEIILVETPWEEINNLQKKLIGLMQGGNDSIDFQNIGTTSRTILDKMARTVFNLSIHIAPAGVDVSNGKFKNQIHTYLAHRLRGGENEEMRAVMKSAIEFAENSVDLINQTVHKLDVKKQFAEVCIISTISVINLVKSIEES